ncbi:hypothetical protein CDL12_06492 [Handroanthus impetiginosus]|uniref:Non-specific serine/threonine protein kinase n=1 Tax=Handroanthus impetiginosus TaxID=429701 RepID=A0A2G9HTH3_9LAMI|nr:hypothetical protein CDL12_06492 [Handroanthus impetiginosus]
MLLAYLCIILCFTVAIAQSDQGLSARELDSLLQDYAFRAFVRPRTGIVFDGNVPSNLTGIRVAALRLRSGSMRRRGFLSYKEFHIPVGVIEQPYVIRLVLVYHDLGNWTTSYYPLPGYRFLTPVLGLLAYNASDLSATNLSELNIRASGEPISIGFAAVESEPNGSSLMCVSFRLDGSVVFDNVVRGNTCLTTVQGHFAIVAQVVAPAPAPGGGGGPGGRKRRSRRAWIIAGSVIGGAAVAVLLFVLLVYVLRCRRRKKMRRMEEAAEMGVPLPMTSVGYTKAPVALETRTRPFLENEFVP